MEHIKECHLKVVEATIKTELFYVFRRGSGVKDNNVSVKIKNDISLISFSQNTPMIPLIRGSLLDVKKYISVTWPISRVFRLAFDLQQCKTIYSFVDISPHFYFICIRFCRFTDLDRCQPWVKHGSLVSPWFHGSFLSTVSWRSYILQNGI